MIEFKLTMASLGSVLSELTSLIHNNSNKKYRIEVKEWKGKRGLPPNAQQHVWYSQIAEHYGDRTALDVKNFCKDAFGLPILLNSPVHGDKIEFLLTKLEYYRYSHESRMKLIQCLEVTSLFNTKESKAYMDQMIFYWNDLGVPIRFKN